MTTRRDLEETLALLWRTKQPGRRGPRGSLTLDQIVGTAIDIANAEGVAGVSMRKVAERLGVTTMSLYRYVPGKDDLLDLMFDMAAGLPDTSDWPSDWRGALAAYARAMRELLRSRSWMLDIPLNGPPMGPNDLAWMEAGLAPLADGGLTEGEMVGVLMLLTGYVMNEVRQEVSMTRAAPQTGVTYEEWGRVYNAMLAKVVADGQHPTLARLVAAGAFEDDPAGPDADFEYGLSFLLDGIEALVRERREAERGDGPDAAATETGSVQE
ncbi:TetR/AcrR family transcriptional regulator [Streptomyces sp. 4N509B]|uniref:TetR/AcrR family transcriptional regulator n=1 Tax=Streptomyces sp. 4N509B TaxID=3457413 RepID=UPI003FD1CE67